MTKCLNCHTWGSKDLSPKCLDCHQPIKKRISAKLGFHGHLEEQDCGACHADHLGADFDLIKWEPSREQFDHDRTGYQLKGKHADLKCETCHTRELIKADDILDYAEQRDGSEFLSHTFLGLGTQCESCHADVHYGEFEDKRCESCHDQQDWKAVLQAFDHSKQTQYPLRGAHAQVDCKKCHTGQQAPLDKFQVHKFSGLQYDRCTRCHEDEHKGAFGQECLECHTVKTFKVSSKQGVFNHETSRFPLLGKHQAVKCTTCHTRDGQFKLASTFDACSDCHEDVHKGAFTKSNGDNFCDQCHSESGFLPPLFGVIEHGKSNFPLTGSHLAVPCFACHKTGDERIYRWQDTNCQSCHDNIHGAQFTKFQTIQNWCERCHQTLAWDALLFDHKATQFALTGRHAQLPCSACHKPKEKVTQYAGVPKDCVACHEDVHARQFSDRSCDHCHATTTWSIIPFDHTRLTRFPLDGQHDKLACGECHKYDRDIMTVRFKPVHSRCQDCHQFGAPN